MSEKEKYNHAFRVCQEITRSISKNDDAGFYKHLSNLQNMMENIRSDQNQFNYSTESEDDEDDTLLPATAEDESITCDANNNATAQPFKFLQNVDITEFSLVQGVSVGRRKKSIFNKTDKSKSKGKSKRDHLTTTQQSSNDSNSPLSPVSPPESANTTASTINLINLPHNSANIPTQASTQESTSNSQIAINRNISSDAQSTNHIISAPNTVTVTCSICSKDALLDKTILCSKCKNCFHKSCEKNYYVPKKGYICNKCKSVR
jgi:hypothetical protein